MPVCFEDVMRFWEIITFISSVSEVEREKNFSLLLNIQIFIRLRLMD